MVAPHQVEARVAPDSGLPEWAQRPALTIDGTAIAVQAACGNLAEVEQAIELGMEAIGIYRTELLFLVDKLLPSREALASKLPSGLI